MSTRLTYTSGASSPETDAAFEAALADVRRDPGAPLPHVVGGIESHDGPEFAREDPSRSEAVASRAHAAPDALVAEAIRVARAAQGGWRRLAVAERTGLLRAAGAAISERHLELAAAVSLEAGKSRTESIAEVQEAVDLIEAYCAQIEAHDGYSVPLGQLTPEETNESVLRPFGVFGVIGPFNFPVALVTGMTAGALVAGNTVVLKPSEHAPRSGALVAEAFAAAGLPEGVIGVVHGGGDTGRALAEGAIDGVVFTGSAEVGRALGRHFQAGAYARPAITEMGGKNPAIVAASADIEAAAAGIASSAYGFSGQKCSACSRAIVVGDAAHDALVAALHARAAELRLGDPGDRDAFTGPVVDARAVARYEAAIAAADRDGEVVAGGAALAAAGPLRGAGRGGGTARGPPAHPRGAVRPVRDRHQGGLVRRGAGGGQRGRLRADRRRVQRRPARARPVPRRDRGRRRLREPARGRDDGRVARVPVVLRLEEQRLDRQGRARPVLRAAVHARAEPHRRDAVIR